jgi:hypothetical protein
VALCAFTIAAVGAYKLRSAGTYPVSVNQSSLSELDSDSLRQEVLLVYVGSVTCPVCHDPKLPVLIERARRQLQQHADSIGARFSFVTIVDAARPHEAVDYLKRFESVDEIVAGNGWLNSGIVQYVTTVHRGPLATPQLLVVTRSTRYSAVDMSSERCPGQLEPTDANPDPPGRTF